MCPLNNVGLNLVSLPFLVSSTLVAFFASIPHRELLEDGRVSVLPGVEECVLPMECGPDERDRRELKHQNNDDGQRKFQARRLPIGLAAVI